jgi:hypothetical protein
MLKWPLKSGDGWIMEGVPKWLGKAGGAIELWRDPLAQD